MRKRNSLIELYRFIFAINVVKSHGLFPYMGPYFGPGRISVEFFFVLTGYLLMKSINKFLDKPFWEGFKGFFTSKLKAIWIPLVIAIPFNIFYCIVIKQYFVNIWGYLWYVKQMLIYIAVCFVMRYFIKNEKKFILLVESVFVVAAVLHVFPLFYSWGVIRALMGISLGILISYIPKLNLKKKGLVWVILVPVQALILAILIFGNNLLMEEVLDLILYPALIYFTFQLTINNKVFNYLGSLSFGLYAFQCVVRPFDKLGFNNVWILFGIIVLLSVLEDGFKRYMRYRKMEKLKTVEGGLV